MSQAVLVKAQIAVSCTFGSAGGFRLLRCPKDRGPPCARGALGLWRRVDHPHSNPATETEEPDPSTSALTTPSSPAPLKNLGVAETYRT